MENTSEHSFPQSLEENLKKALTEMLVLHVLSAKDCYIGELTEAIHTKSHGVLSIVFPYSAIYRLQQAGYLVESSKRTAPDGRRRQYYKITKIGQQYLTQLKETYMRFSIGVAAVLAEEVDSNEQRVDSIPEKS